MPRGVPVDSRPVAATPDEVACLLHHQTLYREGHELAMHCENPEMQFEIMLSEAEHSRDQSCTAIQCNWQLSPAIAK